jgi:hypothetical protein
VRGRADGRQLDALAHQWADGQRVFRLLQLSPITVPVQLYACTGTAGQQSAYEYELLIPWPYQRISYS